MDSEFIKQQNAKSSSRIQSLTCPFTLCSFCCAHINLKLCMDLYHLCAFCAFVAHDTEISSSFTCSLEVTSFIYYSVYLFIGKFTCFSINFFRVVLFFLVPLLQICIYSVVIFPKSNFLHKPSSF